MTEDNDYWGRRVAEKRQELAELKQELEASQARVNDLRHQHKGIVEEHKQLTAPPPDLDAEISAKRQQIERLKRWVATQEAEVREKKQELTEVRKQCAVAALPKIEAAAGGLADHIKTYRWIEEVRDGVQAQVQGRKRLSERVQQVDLDQDGLPRRVLLHLRKARDVLPASRD